MNAENGSLIDDDDDDDDDNDDDDNDDDILYIPGTVGWYLW